MNLEQDIQAIQERNKKVEADKAWETSWTRRLLTAGLTYVVIVIFLTFMSFPQPWLNALVPTLGFIVSTLSLSLVKQWWVKRWYQS